MKKINKIIITNRCKIPVNNSDVPALTLRTPIRISDHRKSMLVINFFTAHRQKHNLSWKLDFGIISWECSVASLGAGCAAGGHAKLPAALQWRCRLSLVYGRWRCLTVGLHPVVAGKIGKNSKKVGLTATLAPTRGYYCCRFCVR